MSMFTKGAIDGVIIRPLAKHLDERGWLAELFRDDEIDQRYRPVMCYISVTQPGIARGPHEHADQADYFGFLGPSNFKIYLWDARKGSPTEGKRQVVYGGEDSPMTVIIPPGVVHAYRNIGDRPGMVVNLPNRLYAGRGKKDPVDEIRHEADPRSPFVLD
jgi:dTDP-4-dehydrorhamnose 3,5-epimerase